MSVGAADFFEELRREYLAEAPSRLSELRKDLAALAAGEADAAVSLKSRFHRLAGSGGSYGFPAISTAARAAETWLAAHAGSEALPDAGPYLTDAIRRVADAFDQAARDLGLPVADPPGAAAFGWRAVVVGARGGRSEAAESILRHAGYEVIRADPAFDPAGIVVSERPNLAVIVEDPDIDAVPTISKWAMAGAGRAAMVVLLGGADADPLRPPFASLDAILGDGRFESDLGTIARQLGRFAATPRSVLIVALPEEAVRSLETACEGLEIRPRHLPSAVELRTLLGQERSDAAIVGWALTDGAPPGPTLIRWLRRQPGCRLTPIIVLAEAPLGPDRLAAIRSGADDVLAADAPAREILETVVARIDHHGVMRASPHRDEMTGLLNEPALTEELDRAIGLARRGNESVACVTLDVDHLRRINERYGQATGDAVLVHLARAIRGTLRASDLAARTGGEEFSAVIRRCRASDAAMVAEKIRAAVLATPVVAEGEDVLIRVSAGVACYPDHGANAGEVLRAANRALAAAKAAGRDRSAISADS